MARGTTVGFTSAGTAGWVVVGFARVEVRALVEFSLFLTMVGRVTRVVRRIWLGFGYRQNLYEIGVKREPELTGT